MSYPEVNFRSARSITAEEALKLYDIILKYKPKRVVELGTFAGYGTIYMAKAMQSYNHDKDCVIFTIDYKQQFTQPKDVAFNINGVSNVIEIREIENYENLKEEFLRLSKSADLIYIDTCHVEVEELWNLIQHEIKDNAIILLHDVLCQQTDEMKVPKLYNALKTKYKTITITTEDNVGNLNGFGIVNFERQVPIIEEKQVVEKKIEEPEKEIEFKIIETSITEEEKPKVVEEKVKEEKPKVEKIKSTNKKQLDPNKPVKRTRRTKKKIIPNE